MADQSYMHPDAAVSLSASKHSAAPEPHVNGVLIEMGDDSSYTVTPMSHGQPAGHPQPFDNYYDAEEHVAQTFKIPEADQPQAPEGADDGGGGDDEESGGEGEDSMPTPPKKSMAPAPDEGDDTSDTPAMAPIMAARRR